MQWIYLICFILISAGLLALFGVKPGDFIDALFRSQRKSATLSDELNVLLGTPAKGFFNQDYELKQILKGTGRADHYEAIKRLSLILFAVGAVLALLIGNVYMVPILGIGFSLIPIWYLRSTAASYKKHLNEELETAISIITTSYLRTEDLTTSVGFASFTTFCVAGFISCFFAAMSATSFLYDKTSEVQRPRGILNRYNFSGAPEGI